jgi:hypothetical protein
MHNTVGVDHHIAVLLLLLQSIFRREAVLDWVGLRSCSLGMLHLRRITLGLLVSQIH